MSDQLYETLERTALDHWHAYQSPGAFDPRKTLQFRSAECVHTLHPFESIPEAFRSPQHTEKYSQALNFLGPPIDRLSFHMLDMCIDTKKRLVTASFKATFDFKAFGDEPVETGFNAEYVWIMQMNAAGTKIDRVEEFLDPERGVAHISEKAQKYASFASQQ